MGAVMALPTAVSKLLKIASRTQVKVIVWFAANGGFDAAACAAATGENPADCQDAMTFWVEQGVLRAEGKAEPIPVSPAAQIELPKPAPKTEKRPTFREAVARQKSSAEFDYLLKTAEQRLGRSISPGEAETFLYIYETVGLPVEVILMLLVYAVRNGKVKSRSGFGTYLEKAALSWAERGIVTVIAAEEELCRQERRHAVRDHITKLFNMERPLTLLQVDAATQWVDEWHFSDEMLLLALAKCREKTDRVNFNYITRVLESWLADGISTPEAAAAAATPKKKERAKPLLSDETQVPDATDYERAAADWRPVYTAKKAKKE